MTTPERIELNQNVYITKSDTDGVMLHWKTPDKGQWGLRFMSGESAEAFAAAMQGEGMGELEAPELQSSQTIYDYMKTCGVSDRAINALMANAVRDHPQPLTDEYKKGLKAAADICGTLAEGKYADGRDFEIALGCEAAIQNAIIKCGDTTHPPASANPVTPSAESVAREIGQISGWQPMDTAPKDGTEFLAMMERVDFEGDVRRAMVFAAWDTTLGEFVRMDMMSQNGWEPTDYLTEWMYCPTQPNPNPAAEEFANSPRQALANKGPAMSNPLLSAFLHNVGSMLAHHGAQRLKRVEGPGSTQFDEVVAGQLNALRELYPEVAGETMFFHNPDGSMPMVPNPNKEDTSGNGGRGNV